MRNSFKYASKAEWPALGAALKLVYHAATLSEAEQCLEDFKNDWEQKYPAISKLRERRRGELVPFLQFNPEIRRIVCTANAIESVNARIGKTVKARGHLPTEQAPLK